LSGSSSKRSSATNGTGPFGASAAPGAGAAPSAGAGAAPSAGGGGGSYLLTARLVS